jgi:hypothetical protein
MSERTTEWAFTLLRPVLQELKVQKLTELPSVVKTSSYRRLITAGMGRWVIIARQASFPDETKGCASLVLSIDHNLFMLVINISKDLFDTDEHSRRCQRKMVAVHEFVHGAAHIFLSSFLKSERYIEIMDKSMCAKMEMTTSAQFNEMLSAIGKLGTRGTGKHEVFTDSHFRLIGEGWVDGFAGNYVELYINLLLSYQLIYETMRAIKLQYEETNIDISKLLRLTHKELVEKKALDREFVLGRIKMFLPKLFSEFV